MERIEDLGAEAGSKSPHYWFSSWLSRRLERIEDLGAEAGDVAGDESEVVDQGGRGEEAVDDADGGQRAHPAPRVGDGASSRHTCTSTRTRL